MSELTDGLRAVAEFLDAHPDLKFAGPAQAVAFQCALNLDEWYQAVDALGPDSVLELDGTMVRQRLTFGAGVSVYVFAAASAVATSTEVGTKTVPVYDTVIRPRPVAEVA